jgi:uncharacterized protein HemX
VTVIVGSEAEAERVLEEARRELGSSQPVSTAAEVVRKHSARASRV